MILKFLAVCLSVSPTFYENSNACEVGRPCRVETLAVNISLGSSDSFQCSRLNILALCLQRCSAEKSITVYGGKLVPSFMDFG